MAMRLAGAAVMMGKPGPLDSIKQNDPAGFFCVLLGIPIALTDIRLIAGEAAKPRGTYNVRYV